MLRSRSTRRLTLAVAAVPLLLAATALLYQLGMAALEGQPRNFWQALAWAGETLSTTGYGADALGATRRWWSTSRSSSSPASSSSS